MPLDAGLCKTINICQSCCPDALSGIKGNGRGMPRFDTMEMTLTLPNRGVTVGVTLYHPSNFLTTQFVSANPADGEYCGVLAGSCSCCNGCFCRFQFALERYLLTCGPVTEPVCDDFPSFSGGHVLAAEMRCITGSFEAFMRLGDATCSGGAAFPLFCSSSFFVTASIDESTLKCQCGDAGTFYAKFGGTALGGVGCGDGVSPGSVLDADGYIEVTGTPTGDPCPDQWPCPDDPTFSPFRCIQFVDVHIGPDTLENTCVLVCLRPGRTDYYASSFIDGRAVIVSMSDDTLPVIKVFALVGPGEFLGSITAYAVVGDNVFFHAGSGTGDLGTTWSVGEMYATKCPCPSPGPTPP